MVQVEEIIEDETPIVEDIPSPSEERLLDAEAIEEAASKMTRMSAKVRLESLAKSLRKESMALKRVEASKSMVEEESNAMDVEPTTTTITASKPAPIPTAPRPNAVSVASAAPLSAGSTYISIDKFAFDAGGYNSPHVTLYVPLVGVGSIPRDQVTCTFTPSSFDLVVKDLNGKSYRLFKDNLDKDIDPEQSKRIVKADKVIIKLGKVMTKSEYGPGSYDYWTDLTAKKGKRKPGVKEDPAGGIMDMMKDMYESGDDNMRKIIGESMQKARNRPPGAPPDDDVGLKGGLNDMGM